MEDVRVGLTLLRRQQDLVLNNLADVTAQLKEFRSLELKFFTEGKPTDGLTARMKPLQEDISRLCRERDELKQELKQEIQSLEDKIAKSGTICCAFQC